MKAASEAAVTENLKPLELDVNTVGGGNGVGSSLVDAFLLGFFKKKQNTR